MNTNNNKTGKPGEKKNKYENDLINGDIWMNYKALDGQVEVSFLFILLEHQRLHGKGYTEPRGGLLSRFQEQDVPDN